MSLSPPDKSLISGCEQRVGCSPAHHAAEQRGLLGCLSSCGLLIARVRGMHLLPAAPAAAPYMMLHMRLAL